MMEDAGREGIRGSLGTRHGRVCLRLVSALCVVCLT